MGIAMDQNVRNSEAPSRREDSRISVVTLDSMNCFMRYRPSVEHQAGTMIARYVSIQPSADIVMKFTIPPTVAENMRDF